MEKQPQGRKKRKQWLETSRTPNLDSRVPLHYGVAPVIRRTALSFIELSWLKASCSPFGIQIEALCSFTSRERIFSYIYGFPTGSDSKESACNSEDLGSIPGLERSPGGRQGNPTERTKHSTHTHVCVCVCVCMFIYIYIYKNFIFNFESESRSVVLNSDSMDYTVPGILQARILEWVAFPFSRGSSQPRN